MPLAPGTRLGSYEVVGSLGAGGMGEVYRARDTRLGRDVALKVVPDRVSGDRERTSRLEREARALAALSHQHIATIYGLEDLPATRTGQSPGIALVMEFVDGETLAARLTRGPIGRDATLAIAAQIADALEAAHRRGIVHRDLKPGNVMITSGDAVKVLDFGLAKVLADVSHDDVTVTSNATAAGLVLGTPAYMSPEQAQGKPTDERADIWAFGVLLFEMLAGGRPFRGGSANETIAAVLTATPDWARVPQDLQPLLRACLDRDPRRRLRDIGDYRWLLGSTPSSEPAGGRSRRRSMPWVAGLALVTGVLAAEMWLSLTPAPEVRDQVVRLTTTLPAGVSLARAPGYSAPVTISPDGRTVIIVGSDKDGQRLYRRPIDRIDSTPIAGTERATCPFFSWDGNWIGFFADGQLKRIPTGGGGAVDITTYTGFPAGASWAADNRIYFAYSSGGLNLRSVDAQGGQAEPLPGVESGQNPEVLPDGKILFESNGWVYLFDRATGQRTRLIEGRAPRYARGHVVMSRGTTLLAAPFDLSRMALSGPVVPVVEGVAVELPLSGGGRQYAIADSGALVYVPATTAYALMLLNADGSERMLAEEQRSFENPRFSPNGRHVVVATTRRDGENSDLWIHEVATGIATRLTFNGGRAPIWTPDGTAITYSQLAEKRGIYLKRADGQGEASLLVPLTSLHWLVGWTPTRTLAYAAFEGGTSSIVAFENNQSRRVTGPGSTWGGRLSDDGKWLAYYVLTSGTFEVYVAPFPEGGPRWLIAEGTDPSWTPDASEILYRSGARLMAARIDKAGGGIRVLSHRIVVESFLPPLYDDYHIHPDGKTLVVVRPANRSQGREVTIVTDWISELQKLVGES